jgi:nicotinamidase/pyrazinamidase
LYVNGAEDDMMRLAKMIDKYGSKIDDISVTLDSHHLLHIAHPIFWKNSSGQNPQPFTIITADDVRNGIWMPHRPTWLRKFPEKDFGALEYVESLEKNGKYPLCIWPPHCLIGSAGHMVYPPLYEALLRWEQKEFASVNYVTKGSNHFTEHYSAISADVPDATDHTTQLNTDFLNSVIAADQILLAGEAGSHCLANTGRDADAYFKNNSFVNKLTLLKDATSPVPGFESFQESFIKDMTVKGMQLAKTTDFV